MSAFGPYTAPTVLDLDLLGTGGIYLITGDTGSGKTTIFDAICYALFGKASGDVRDGAALRSRNAPPEVKTEVGLEFVYKDKRYGVKRSPEYMRKKTRGEGLTKESAYAELILPDGKVVTGQGEVTAKVTEILGVDKGQFSQIAMIAQGDFQRLLIAKTEDRRKIFGKIFDTGRYEVLGNRLRDEANRLLHECQSIEALGLHTLCGVRIAGEMTDELSALTEGRLTPGESIAVIEELISLDRRSEGECEAAVAELEKKRSTLAGKINTHESLLALKESVTLARAELSRLTSESESFNAAYQAALARGEGLAALSESIARLTATLPDYEAAEDAHTVLAEMLREQGELSAATEQAVAERTELDKKIAADEARLSALSAAAERIGEVRLRLTELEGVLSGYGKALAELDSMQDCDAQVFILTEQYERDRERLRRLTDAYSEMNIAYLDAQAGILAKTLADGEPCPVCGSTEHPAPARMPTDAPDKAALDLAQSEVAQATECARASSEMLGAKRGALAGIQKSLEACVAELPSCCALDLAVASGDGTLRAALTDGKEKTQALCREAKEELLSLEAEASQRTALEESIPSAKARAAKLSSLERERRDSLSALNARIDETKKKAAELQGKLEYKSRNDAQKVINDLQSEHILVSDAVKSAKDALDKCTGEIARQKGIIDGGAQALSGLDGTDIDALREELSALDKRREELLGEIRSAHSRLEANTAIVASLGDLLSRGGECERRYKLVRLLSDTANGSLSGKEKVSLEAYVQGAFFDRIINRANLRLMRMTAGQYELVRRAEAENNQSKSGLELDVIDHYTASSRSVRTLSGGETFMASLSLALGLSDEISSRSGGIQLDTMFVDEGFGSLSPDSLDAAIRVLCSLEEGGRLVGIISHVGELKERIDKQIVVTKNKSGESTVVVRP